MRASEERLKTLLVRGLAGDAAAYHGFLKDLSVYLRAFLRRHLARLPDEVEDLIQETLLAIHKLTESQAKGKQSHQDIVARRLFDQLAPVLIYLGIMVGVGLIGRRMASHREHQHRE